MSHRTSRAGAAGFLLKGTAAACLVAATAVAAAGNPSTTFPVFPRQRQQHSWTRHPLESSRSKREDVVLSLRGGGGAGRRTVKPKPTRSSSSVPKPEAAASNAVADRDEGASIATSVFNLANNVAGAGILTLAAGKASGTGWIPSIAICLALAAVSSHTFSLVAKSCELTGLDSFKDLWSYAFGGGDETKSESGGAAETAWIVDTMVFVQCFFVSVIYTGLLGDVFSALLRGTLGIEAWWSSREAVIVTAAACVLFPLNLIRDLSSLGFTSVLGLIAVLYTVGFIVVRSLDGTYAIGNGVPVVDGGIPVGRFVAEGLLPRIPSFAKSTLWNVDLNSLVLTSNLGLAFIAHYNAPSYWKSLGRRATSERFGIVSRRAYLILAAIYATTMAAGYATFGDESMGNILLNYSGSDALATLGRLATGLSIVFGFPLISNGCREGLKNAFDALGWLDGAASDPANRTKLVLSLLVATTTLSIVAKDIGLVAGLTGALMGSSLVYVCPPLLYARIVGRKRGTDSDEYRNARRNLAFIPFGIFTASMGMAMTLRNALGRPQ